MALANYCCEIVWIRKLALGLGFLQLEPIDVYEDNTVGIALVNNRRIQFLTGPLCISIFLPFFSLQKKIGENFFLDLGRKGNPIGMQQI